MKLGILYRLPDLKETRSTRSFDRDIDQNPSSTSAFPLTKGYLNAEKRHLATSTLKLWQGGGSNLNSGDMNQNKRKTKSVYNLQDCMV